MMGNNLEAEMFTLVSLQIVCEEFIAKLYSD